MPPPKQSFSHTVAPGDHLSRVAATNGFKSYVPLVDDAANEPLMRLRKTPHVLGVGDPVDVPPLEGREVERVTDERHRFNANIPELVVRVRHTTWAGAAVAPPSSATGDGKPLPVTPASDGMFAVDITPLTDRLIIDTGDRTLLARVGFLQPIDTITGTRQRLTNLGYEAGEKDDPTDLQFRSAVEEFQCDHGLIVDGVAGQNTRARLLKLHGC